MRMGFLRRRGIIPLVVKPLFDGQRSQRVFSDVVDKGYLRPVVNGCRFNRVIQPVDIRYSREGNTVGADRTVDARIDRAFNDGVVDNIIREIAPLGEVWKAAMLFSFSLRSAKLFFPSGTRSGSCLSLWQ